jgi:hypothetical protein
MPSSSDVNPNGDFVSNESAPGRYLLEVRGLPEGWRLRSAVVNGHDAADEPIDLNTDLSGAVLTFTDRRAELRGRVMNTSGVGSINALVLAYPANRTLWTDFGPGRRFRFAVAGADGHYAFADLPAGEYLVAAVMTVPESGWKDEVWLTSLAPLSDRMTVVEGAVKTLNLVLRPSPKR